MMKWDVNYTNVQYSVSFFLIFCSLLRTKCGETCSMCLIHFTRIRCYGKFGVTELNLYNLSRNTFSECTKHCAHIRQCTSVLIDSRYDTCAFYRPKMAQHLSDSVIEQKYYLNYNKQGNVFFKILRFRI